MEPPPTRPTGVASTWPEIVNFEDLQATQPDTLRSDVVDAFVQLFPPGALFSMAYQREFGHRPIRVKVYEPFRDACTEILATAFLDVAFPPRESIETVSDGDEFVRSRE